MNAPLLLKACSVPQLQRSKRYVLEYQDLKILLLNIGSELIAIDQQCPHQGLPLDQAFIDLENNTITCPYHHWCFRLTDGKSLSNQSQLRQFTLEVKDGFVWVKLDPGSC